MSAERTEEATTRRRDDRRREGHVARSDELTRCAVLAAATIAIASTATTTVGRIVGYATQSLDSAFTAISPTAALWASADLLYAISAPLLGIAVLSALLVSLVQVGPLVTLRPVVPDFGRLFRPSGSDATQFLLDAIRAFAVLVAVGFTSISAVRRLLTLPRGTLATALEGAHSIVLDHVAPLLSALTLLALLDLVWVRWRYARDIRMSRTDKLEEARRAEGDPRLRARRRQLHRDLVDS